MNSTIALLPLILAFCSATILRERKQDVNCLMDCSDQFEQLPRDTIANEVKQNRANKSSFLLEDDPQMVCSKWATIKNCLQDSGASQQLLGGFGVYEYVCSELNTEHMIGVNCSEVHHETFAAHCESELDKAIESAIAPVQLYCEFTDPVWGYRATESSVNSHCSADTALAECLDPLYRKTCGDRAANAKRTYAGLYLNQYKMLFGLSGGQTLSPECETLIATAEGTLVEKLQVQENNTLGEFWTQL